MFTSGLSRSVIFRTLSVMIAAMLLLTGCKSSRSSARRGGSGPSEVVGGSASDNDYAAGVKDRMAKALINEAQGWIGTRYLYGGESKKGTDCSGLVMRVFDNVCGLKLPRSTREQVKYCTKVARNRMRPGDLVFFASGKRDDKVFHVGLYIGDGKMIHASSSRGVIVSDFDSGYWGERYFTGGRVDSAPRAFASSNGGKKEKSEKKVKNGKGKKQPPADTPAVPLASPAKTPATTGTPTTIDLLDLIINQKVDSIFTSEFSD